VALTVSICHSWLNTEKTNSGETKPQLGYGHSLIIGEPDRRMSPIKPSWFTAHCQMSISKSAYSSYRPPKSVKSCLPGRSLLCLGEQVDHAGFYVFLAKQFLHSTDVLTVVQHVRSEVVPRGSASIPKRSQLYRSISWPDAGLCERDSQAPIATVFEAIVPVNCRVSFSQVPIDQAMQYQTSHQQYLEQ